MFSTHTSPYSSCLHIVVSVSFFVMFVKKNQNRKMHNRTFGEIFGRAPPRVERPSRSTQSRPSYNGDLIAPNIGEGDDGDAHPSTFPCTNFLNDAGILDDFLYLVDRVGLTTYMLDESNQYAMLTKTFVESLSLNNSPYNPTISFKIYDNPFTMT